MEKFVVKLQMTQYWCLTGRRTTHTHSEERDGVDWWSVKSLSRVKMNPCFILEITITHFLEHTSQGSKITYSTTGNGNTSNDCHWCICLCMYCHIKVDYSMTTFITMLLLLLTLLFHFGICVIKG